MASQTIARGINDDGQIVGTYVDSTGQHAVGFIYNPIGGTFAAINYPSATDTLAMGIMDDGQIVGGYSEAGLVHGFLYNPNGGTYTTLDAP